MNRDNSTTYIAFLRGINVGGHVVKMDVLRKLFEDMGFKNVRSYIQTGNVFFASDEDEEVLRAKIEKKLEKSLGFAVPVCLRTIEEVEKLLQTNPFEKTELTPDKRFSVVFLAQPTNADIPIPYFTPDGGYELIGRTQKELFLVWHLKNGRPASNFGILKQSVGEGTIRFWHTVAKILTEAQQQ